ncbi:MAG TPA: hypothetical protein P5560_09170 [Thermotogota bacterium]|nr:hypothetical protein [Thermotogota bacterium]HRW93102.1 hypothetical protein [Thermotogota bacterium]
MEREHLDTLMEFLNMPVGGTEEVFAKFENLPGAIARGEGLERFVYIPGSRENRVLLVAHADTYDDLHYCEEEPDSGNLVIGGGKISREKGILGADDRAGCAMIWILKDMGHSLLIVSGEEHGQVGSHWLMEENLDIADEINQTHQFLVELDRANATDFKCYDVGTEAFREYVSKETSYTEPDRLSCTDIKTLCRDVCGVNLSVGYQNEHYEDEILVLDDWEHTLQLCQRWLSNKELPRFPLVGE